MKLYYSKGTCSLAPHIVINELNIPCDFISVDYATKEASNGIDFKKMAPKGFVPLLQMENGEILTEGVAIMQYLADFYSGERLLPKVKTMERYRVLEWLNFLTSEIHKGFGTLAKFKKDESVKENFVKNLQFANSALEGKNHLVLEALTLADIYLFVTISWLDFGLVPVKRESFANLERFFMQMKEVPSVKKALEDEAK